MMRLVVGLFILVLIIGFVIADDELIIQEFENGNITWTDTRSNGVYYIEYASVIGSNTLWGKQWPPEQYINATGGTHSALVPVFYRLKYIPYDPWVNEWSLIACDNGTNFFDPVVKWEPGDWDPTEHQNSPYFEGTNVRTGILELHPVAGDLPAKLKLKSSTPLEYSTISVTTCGNVGGDFVLECNINGMTNGQYTIDGSAWTTCVFDVSAYIGQNVDIQIWNVAGGLVGWHFENAYIDDIILSP